MNANLKLQVAGLTNRAGILIGSADLIEQFVQVTAMLVQENEVLTKKTIELEAKLALSTATIAPAATPSS